MPNGELEMGAIGSTLEGIGAVVMPLMLGLALLVGLVMWVLGRKLARPACAVSGVVLGGLGGLLVAELLRDHGAFVIPLVIGMGIAGGLLAALLFRVWMAVSAAALLALAVPAAMVAWENPPAMEREAAAVSESSVQVTSESAVGDESQSRQQRGPESDLVARPDEAEGVEGVGVDLEDLQMPPGLEWLEKLAERIFVEGGDWDEAASDVEIEEGEEKSQSRLGDLAGDELGRVVNDGREAVRTWYAEHRQRVAVWWDELSPGARRGLFVGAALGGLLGLTLGLAVPYTAAAVQSALAGAVLMYLAGREMVDGYAPNLAQWLPQSPRATLMWVGLITVLGVLLQWTLFHRRADK